MKSHTWAIVERFSVPQVEGEFVVYRCEHCGHKFTCREHLLDRYLKSTKMLEDCEQMSVFLVCQE